MGGRNSWLVIRYLTGKLATFSKVYLCHSVIPREVDSDFNYPSSDTEGGNVPCACLNGQKNGIKDQVSNLGVYSTTYELWCLQYNPEVSNFVFTAPGVYSALVYQLC